MHRLLRSGFFCAELLTHECTGEERQLSGGVEKSDQCPDERHHERQLVLGAVLWQMSVIRQH